MSQQNFIIETLVKSGFRTSLKGFGQFCECVRIYLIDRTSTLESIYIDAGKKFNTGKSAVEKNIRRLFDTSPGCAAIGDLFDVEVSYASNKELIAMFANYVEINSEHYEHTI